MQVVGNSAAVQVDIAIPGMAGTSSHVDGGFTTRTTHIAGVGYRSGEAYAKWGRFACEDPLTSCAGRDHHPPGGVSTRQSRRSRLERNPLTLMGGRSRSCEGEGKDVALDGGSGGDEATSPTDTEDGTAATTHQTPGIPNTARTMHAPLAGGCSAYLEVSQYECDGAIGFSRLICRSHHDNLARLESTRWSVAATSCLAREISDIHDPEGRHIEG